MHIFFFHRPIYRIYLPIAECNAYVSWLCYQNIVILNVYLLCFFSLSISQDWFLHILRRHTCGINFIGVFLSRPSWMCCSESWKHFYYRPSCLVYLLFIGSLFCFSQKNVHKSVLTVLLRSFKAILGYTESQPVK